MNVRAESMIQGKVRLIVIVVRTGNTARSEKSEAQLIGTGRRRHPHQSGTNSYEHMG